jgi:hypothetical protein
LLQLPKLKVVASSPIAGFQEKAPEIVIGSFASLTLLANVLAANLAPVDGNGKARTIM